MEQTDPTGGWVSALGTVIEYIEEHPTAVLVVVLGFACWWLARQWNKARSERDLFVKEMWRAKSEGHTFGDSKAEQTLMQFERRKKKR